MRHEINPPHSTPSSCAAWLLACLCLCAALLGCSRQPSVGPATQTIDASNDGGTIDLEVGDRLIVRLPGNLTTGYTWEQDPAPMPSLERVSDKQYVRDASNTIGQGGYFQWAFQATQVGTTHLKLTYQRPFEPDADPAKTFVVAVQVF